MEKDIVIDNQTGTGLPKLWISYPWISREERNFSYLTRHLRNVRFDAEYDSFKIMPEAQLSQRVVQRLQGIGFDGWLYILTHQCITRREYTDELIAAIDQTRLHMGPRFPMVGLMYGIASTHLPPMIRILPCVSLGDPNWNTHVREVFAKNHSSGVQPEARKESRFIWDIHPGYGGDSKLTCIEVRTRGETVEEWRFAVPKSSSLLRWGQGNSGGGEISKVRFGEVSGTGHYDQNEVFWFGASNSVSNSESAYIIFSGKLPDFICFGPAKNSNGIPGRMEIFWPAYEKNRRTALMQ